MVHLVGYGVVHAVRQQKRKHHYPDLVLMIMEYISVLFNTIKWKKWF